MASPASGAQRAGESQFQVFSDTSYEKVQPTVFYIVTLLVTSCSSGIVPEHTIAHTYTFTGCLIVGMAGTPESEEAHWPFAASSTTEKS